MHCADGGFRLHCARRFRQRWSQVAENLVARVQTEPHAKRRELRLELLGARLEPPAMPLRQLALVQRSAHAAELARDRYNPVTLVPIPRSLPVRHANG